ncbi:hypothetical protein MD484_g4491, partial [Candolleomyces efflorescens]
MPPGVNSGGATLLSRIRSLRRENARIKKEMREQIVASERNMQAQVLFTVDMHLRALGFQIDHLEQHHPSVAGTVEGTNTDESEEVEDATDSDGLTDADAEGETDRDTGAEGEGEDGDSEDEEQQQDPRSDDQNGGSAEGSKQAVSSQVLRDLREEKENQPITPSGGSGKSGKGTVGFRGEALGNIQNTSIDRTVHAGLAGAVHQAVPAAKGVPTSQSFQPRIVPQAYAFCYNENALVYPQLQHFNTPVFRSPTTTVNVHPHGRPIDQRQYAHQQASYPVPVVVPQVVQAQLQPAQQQFPHPNQVPPVNTARFQSYAEELANYHHAQLMQRLVAQAPSLPTWNPNFQQYYGGGFMTQPKVLAPQQYLVPVYGGHGCGHLTGSGPQIAAPQPVRPIQQLAMFNLPSPGYSHGPVEGSSASSRGSSTRDPRTPTVQATTGGKVGGDERSSDENREPLKRAESDRSSEEDRGAKKRKLGS